jgi:hypothetical protein
MTVTLAFGELGHLDDTEVFRRLQAAKRAAARDLLRDPATLARGLDPGYRMRPHVKVISEALVGLERGEYDRLLVTTPAQVGKSSLVAEWFPFWWLLLHGEDRVAVASYSDDLAIRRGKAIRRYIQEYGGEYGLSLLPGSEAAQDYDTNQGGGVRSVSLGAGLTGFGVNLLCVDDPHKDRAEAESKKMRDKVHDWWSSAALKRLQPDRNAVVIIQTRWHCLAYDQPVSTVIGPKSVQDIQPGELVLTSSGYQPVLATAARLHRGETLTFGFYGSPETLHVTPEHRVWTEHGWREAREVQRLDWMLLPTRPDAEMTAEELAALLPAPLSPRRDPAKTTRVKNAPVTREQLQAHLDDGMTYQQIAELYGRKTRAAAYEWARALGITKPAGNVLSPECLHDPDFWTVVGHWIAEGTLTYGKEKDKSNVCRWSFGEHEQETLATRTRDVLKRYGLTAAVNLRGRADRCEWVDGDVRQTAVVTVSSAQLASLLQQFGRGAKNKHLPDWAYRLPRSYALALVDGWTSGDGCDGVNGFKRVSSASFRLLRDMQTLLAKHGVAASIMRTGQGAGTQHELRYRTSGGNRHIRADERGLWVKVKNLESTQYDGPVYDLQTPTGDFVAGGVLVHNCDDLAGRRLEEDGRLEDGGRWKVVHLPAIANPSKFGPDPLGRRDGDPLPHPKIPTRNRRKLIAWWDDVKATSTVRDWHALSQGDPQPSEGALVSRDLLRSIRDGITVVEPQRIAVSIDPSGGGRDTAGIIGGFLGADNRVWITHDRTKAMSSAEWSRTACLLAHETNAGVIYVEWNFGRDMCTLAIGTAWQALQDEGAIPKGKLMPGIDAVSAKQGKLLRAEPIAQQMVEDRVRLRGAFVDLENEWAVWQPSDPDSPGRIDASCVLVYGLIPEVNQGAIVHAPLPTAPNPGQFGRGALSGPASAYGRRIGS